MSAAKHTPGSFVVLRGWRFEVRPFVKTTEQMVFYMDGSRERRRSISEVALVLPTEVEAQRLADQLTSAKAEKERRERAAREWLEERTRELIAKARGEA